MGRELADELWGSDKDLDDSPDPRSDCDLDDCPAKPAMVPFDDRRRLRG